MPVLDWTRPREKRPGHLPVDMLSFPRFTSIKPCPPGGNPGRDAADSLTGRSLTRALGERAGVQEGDPTITAPQITAWNLPGYHRTPCAARSAATADEILWPCAVAIEIEALSRNRSWSWSRSWTRGAFWRVSHHGPYLTIQCQALPHPSAARPAGRAGAWKGRRKRVLKQRITKCAVPPWQPLGELKPGRERWSLPPAFHAQEPCYRTCLKSRQDPTFLTALAGAYGSDPQPCPWMG